MGSLQEFKKNKTINKIDVKIINVADKNKFIVADEKDLMILIINDDKKDEKLLIEGNSIRLIKPKYVDENTMEINKNFRTMKIKPVEANFKGKKLQTMLDLAKSIQFTPTKEKPMTFQELDQKPANSEAFNLVFKVCSVSRAMEGKYSKFKLAMIKDRENLKNNLAIYPPHLDRLETSKLYLMSIVKKTNYKKEDEKYFRLSTVRKSEISEYKDNDKIFEHVTVGEFEVSGIVLGYGEIHVYNACVISWMKIRESNKCDAHGEKIEDCQYKIEFVLDIYVDTGDEVETFSGFRRHFNLVDKDAEEEQLEGILDDKYVSHKTRIEYNQDKDEIGKKRIVQIEMNP